MAPRCVYESSDMGASQHEESVSEHGLPPWRNHHAGAYSLACGNPRICGVEYMYAGAIRFAELRGPFRADRT